ncbi:hypothetical protein E3I90_02615 [Candidatus Bathyarchaeota archaeon]|nr:MAG: hypothetical protein E3I90_02615 [Candidatus Bathyarchaeota archaeon]
MRHFKIFHLLLLENGGDNHPTRGICAQKIRHFATVGIELNVCGKVVLQDRLPPEVGKTAVRLFLHINVE